jgi:hypothetical protein
MKDYYANGEVYDQAVFLEDERKYGYFEFEKV